MTPSSTDDDFGTPWVLLCEGRGDERFFTKLFKTHGVGKNFTIKVPFSGKGALDEFGGRESFGSYLMRASVNERFIDNVKAVLVVADNDDDPALGFQKVIEELKMVDGWPVPEVERKAFKKDGAPTVVVLMLPIDEPGNLETVCLEAAYAKFGLEEEVAEFSAKTPANDWPISKRSKMEMQVLLASNNRKQPDAGFAASWSQKEKYQIPADHACFNPIVDFIAKFEEILDE